jgi:hypothetical protein
MMVLAGLICGAMLCGKEPPLSSIEVSIHGQINVRDQIIPYIELHNADIHEALRTLFKTQGIKVSIGPGIHGGVTIALRNVTVQIALEYILRQVDATFRIEGDTILIQRKFQETPIYENGRANSNFIPGEYSSRYDFSSPVIFETPQKTKGGTCDMLLEAVRAGGFSQWFIWDYGNSGFAIVLPFETIHDNGRPSAGSSRFGYKPKYLAGFDFPKIGDYVASEYEVLDRRYRVIVLVASTEPIAKAGVGEITAKSRIEVSSELSNKARTEKWRGELKVSALVYEFKGGNKVEPAQILANGKGLPARTHLVAAGLWPAGMLK